MEQDIIEFCRQHLCKPYVSHKYTIDGKEYKVQIEGVEDNIASVNVNGEAYKVEMEKEAEPEKKKVVLGKPAAASDDAEATPAANVNTANAVKAPLPGTITSIEVTVGQEVNFSFLKLAENC